MVVNIGSQATEYDILSTEGHFLAADDVVTGGSYGIDSADVTFVRLVIAGDVLGNSLGIAIRTAATTSDTSVLAGASVVGFNNDGIALDGDNATLSNAGEIIGHGDAGIDGTFGDGTQIIANSGMVYGDDEGVVLGGDNGFLSNTGDISGGNGVTIRSTADLTNSGTINGVSDGGFGIEINNNPATDVVRINNKGTIGGDDTAIQGDTGVEQVFNSGVLVGDVVLDNGNDTYRASGSGQVLGNVRGGGGNDDLRGADAADELVGGNGDDKIKGRAGEDTLEGGNGRDIIFGGNDDDVITGGNAGDLMLGGSGSDEFLFTDTGDIGTTGATRDEIRDFEQGVDVINLSAMVGPDFIFLGTGNFTGGAAPELRLVEAGGSTFVQLDYDGDGSQDGRMLVRGVVDMTTDDFIL